ncbi:5-methyltetrahydropteroyltriglutamate--homocysteine S-methyltransferase [uncultured Pseudoteredinibacter sp.]|uniref:5-methyltetrahydropteroyltriglutamate-- homocysteine S-methyltransferase n=1 Tax=uncultured Pseudoteredinibacter sp. TaxID=1641701 RepID=UPI0026288FA4|nr:5-methyltetrahydropteroyltriglutamate--homocysteine S-methyltransferase [uncultured Pseudoteredinibacter sp.]
MAHIHSLGFPRIGAQRELKFALEAYWAGELSSVELMEKAKQMRSWMWQQQKDLDLISVGDFSLYDQVLDTSFALGNIPDRAQAGCATRNQEDFLAAYFKTARGRSVVDSACGCTQAAEMTKWFDSNYHYIVPEISAQTEFSANPNHWLESLKEFLEEGYSIERAKPVIIGPVTYLYLSKARDKFSKLDLLPNLLSAYKEILQAIAQQGVEWVQIDEPILSLELDREWRHAINLAYHQINGAGPKILLANYFCALADNLRLACDLPVQGLHIDAVNAEKEIKVVADWLPSHKVLSLGIINGRNIWRNNLDHSLSVIKPIIERREADIWLAPSCSLLHVPVDLDLEAQAVGDETDIRSVLAFAKQKLQELKILSLALSGGEESVERELLQSRKALSEWDAYQRAKKTEVRQRSQALHAGMYQRQSIFSKRRKLQQQALKLPLLPSTTIGSFPQTSDIRRLRRAFKSGQIGEAQYQQQMRSEISKCIKQQEEIGLDVLVHGEAERNDMVEYFGEQLDGFAFSRFAWVQSYGSRCVKPPIIYGDVERAKPMTVSWARFAQSCSDKPVKGMLTGPVTILNWSFVRDDQPRKTTCEQIALAIRDEVLDLEAAGIKVIQIDEAALREGLPLKRSAWENYLKWAVRNFKLSANGVDDATQIHTHMCYSEFNDIIEHIADMDADVITIENSRSGSELLQAFEDFNYPNDIGPGVYDIHSPNTPSTEAMAKLLREANKNIDVNQLWVNPDCGLKTRKAEEVWPALKNMVAATKILREEFSTQIA